jgi:hypothetical protein
MMMLMMMMMMMRLVTNKQTKRLWRREKRGQKTQHLLEATEELNEERIIFWRKE